MWNRPEEISAVGGPNKRPFFIGNSRTFYLGNTRSILEFAYDYKGSHDPSATSVMCIAKYEYDIADSFGSRLKKLSEDGYLDIRLKEMDEKTFEISSIALTASGELLLMQLRRNDLTIRFRNQFFNIFGIVLTSIITTLVVLKIKGF